MMRERERGGKDPVESKESKSASLEGHLDLESSSVVWPKEPWSPAEGTWLCHSQVVILFFSHSEPASTRIWTKGPIQKIPWNPKDVGSIQAPSTTLLCSLCYSNTWQGSVPVCEMG